MAKPYNSVVFWDGAYFLMEIGGDCHKLATDLSEQIPDLCSDGALPINRIVLAYVRKSEDGNVFIRPKYCVDIEDSSVSVPFSALMVNKEFLLPFLEGIGKRIRSRKNLHSG